MIFYIVTDGEWDSSIENIVISILTFSGFITSIFIAPFIVGFLTRKNEHTIQYSNYFIQVTWVILMSILVGGSLMALGSIAIGSIVTLFDLQTWMDRNHLFENWAIIALSIIAPFYALAHLPHRQDYDKPTFIENRFFYFILRNIATPFICIYFLILYAYSAKVLLNFSDWPK